MLTSKHFTVTAEHICAVKAAQAEVVRFIITIKCVTAKKKRGDCHKKTVCKQWIEYLVVNATMQMLIDTFINAIFLYDYKMLITFNYKDGTKTITFDDVKKEAPRWDFRFGFGLLWYTTNFYHFKDDKDCS